MKRTFEIEHPDSHGPEWLNEDNVQLVFNEYCKGAGVVVREITKNQGEGDYHIFSMSPERKKWIGDTLVEEYYWNGKMVVYIDHHVTKENFLEACINLKNQLPQEDESL